MANLLFSFSQCLRHAFMSGAGYGDCDKISEEDLKRWSSYDFPEVGSFARVKEALEAAVASKPHTGLTFGAALTALKEGCRVAREGWNGKGMFIFMVPGSEFKVNRPPLLGIYPEGTPITYRPHIDMKAADGSVAVWNPSQVDMFADDWTLVLEDEKQCQGKCGECDCGHRSETEAEESLRA